MTNWGDVPTWVGAITTTGAFATAAVIVRIEMKREDRAETAATRGQAEKVAAWERFFAAGDGFGWQGNGVEIRNGSHLPIYDVNVGIIVNGLFTSAGTKGVVGPGSAMVAMPTSLETVDPVHRGVLLSFRDCAGARWHRDPDGTLRGPN